MADSGLLFSIFPELFPLTKNLSDSPPKPLQNKKKCSELKHATILNAEIHGVLRELKFEHNAEIGQDTKLCKRIFGHTIRAYNLLETILNGDFNSPINPVFIIDKKNIPSLKLAILLHDIGKPATRKIDADNTVTFKGHDKKGAEISKTICKRLKTSSKQTDYITFIIKNHLDALYLFQKNRIEPDTKEAEIKFFIKHGDRTPDLLIHTIADILGKNGTPLQRDMDFVFFGIKLYNKFQNQFLPAKSLPPLITGADIIKKFGLKPSPLFAKILNKVEIAQINKKITNKAEALKIAEKIISSNS
jgi:poly(A) polymerase